MKKLISIVIPFYNEESNINKLYERLESVFGKERKYDFEVVSVEHGSTDNTFRSLLNLRKFDKRIKILQLSRNFGTADAGIAAGLNFSRGDAAVIMMGDLQEPPDLITKFLRKWEQGYEIVYGIVTERQGISKTRNFNSVIFYKILNYLTGNLFPENVSDFRLMDRKVYESVNKMEERNKFLRGMIIWTGFNQIGVPYKRAPRYSGKSKADFLTALRVASNGIFSFSYMPLRITTILGFSLSIISFLLIIYQVMLFLLFGRGQPGVSTIVVLIGFLFGAVFLILGVIGEYLSRIYEEVKRRPTFIVKDQIGFKS